MDKLTARQRRIFDQLILGKTDNEIVRELGLSVGTMQIEIRRIYWRLGHRLNRPQIRKAREQLQCT